MVDTLNLTLSAFLALLTFVYVYFTYRLFLVGSKSAESQARPVLAISVTNLKMGEKFLEGKRQDFSVRYQVRNIGNSAAIAVSVDCELRLSHNQIDEDNSIPQRFPPDSINFLPESYDHSDSFSFGDKACKLLREDCRDAERKNQKRIELDPTQKPIVGPVIHVSAYYRNIHGDLFVSRFSSSFGAIIQESDGRGGFTFAGWGMPDGDENISFSLIRYETLDFSTDRITQRDVSKEMLARDERRSLSGW